VVRRTSPRSWQAKEITARIDIHGAIRHAGAMSEVLDDFSIAWYPSALTLLLESIKYNARKYKGRKGHPSNRGALASE
jgi:hypothetical protein